MDNLIEFNQRKICSLSIYKEGMGISKRRRMPKILRRGGRKSKRENGNGKGLIMACVFPGQGGTIKRKMGLDLYLNSSAARKIFREADSLLKRYLSDVCFFGTEEELLKNYNSQLASLVTNLAYAAQLEREKVRKKIIPKGVVLKYLAGYSIGYIAALVFAEVITFEQAIRIVVKRAAEMTKAAKNNPGRMIILFKPKTKKVIELMQQLGLGGNLNSLNSQIVLSGPISEITEAETEINKNKLAHRVIPLKIEGGLHSKCMADAEIALAEFIEGMTFNDPQHGYIIIGNSSNQLITTGAEAKREAAEHLSRPVLWWDTMRVLRELGVRYCIEVGHGKVLSDFGGGKKLKISPISDLPSEMLCATETTTDP